MFLLLLLLFLLRLLLLLLFILLSSIWSAVKAIYLYTLNIVSLVFELFEDEKYYIFFINELLLKLSKSILFIVFVSQFLHGYIFAFGSSEILGVTYHYEKRMYLFFFHYWPLSFHLFFQCHGQLCLQFVCYRSAFWGIEKTHAPTSNCLLVMQ